MKKDLPPGIALDLALGKALINGIVAGMTQTEGDKAEVLAGEQFEEWLASLARETLPADIVERAKRALADVEGE